MKYVAYSGTCKNTKSYSKPNEDACLIDSENQVYIIVDGVSRDVKDGVYPFPSPAKEASRVFIQGAYSKLQEELAYKCNYEGLIFKAFTSGNEAVKNANCSFKGDFLPGTVGIICFIRDDILYYGYIGDCLGIVLSNKEKRVFTTCQTKLVNEHGKEFTKTEIRQHICNNIDHPYGYGVLNGKKEALQFVRSGTISLDGFSGFILCTDGAEGIINKLTSKELLELTVEEMLKCEVLTKNTDDKTIIQVKEEINCAYI